MSANPADNAGSNQDLDVFVLNYLKKRGYKQAEAHFKQEAQHHLNIPAVSLEQFTANAHLDQDSTVANYIMFYNSGETSPNRYNESYVKLREWVYSSLDIYKQELLVILYPIFIHCYLDLISKNHTEEAKSFLEQHTADHEETKGDEITFIKAVTTPAHLAENEHAQKFRNNKYNVKMCAYSFELLVNFLHESKFMLLLSIVNQYLNIKVTQIKPGSKEESLGITGMKEREVSQMNAKEIFWALFEEDKPKEEKKEEETIDEEGQGKEGKPKDENKPKEKKKDAKGKKKDKDKEPEKPKPKSSVPLPKPNDQTEAELQDDATKCVKLSTSALPSICFYTLFHTHRSLNTVEISKDASLVVGGFADSSVRLWDLKMYSDPKITDDNEEGSTTTRRSDRQFGGDKYKHFVGHSGPVFGASISFDNQFLLTSSEDNTVRLWSMETQSNVVSYRSHNHPVWDVSFSPAGYYFATASHDRTARLWATPYANPLRIFAGHLADVTTVRFHPNVNYVATGSTDKSLRLWEVHTGKCVRIFTGHQGAINTLAFSPDGRYLASGGDDQNVILWDIATSKRVALLNGHTRAVYSVDFSAEGNIIASGSLDGTVRLWDAAAAANSSQKPLEGAPPPPTDASTASPLQIQSYSTKQTPVFSVSFTRRNLLMAAGPFLVS